MLADKARGLRSVDFRPQSSLYYASRRWHLGRLKKEFALRRQHGFDVQWLDRAKLHARHGVDAPGALLTALAASVDLYRMTYRLLARLHKRGTAIFDRSTVERLEATARQVRLHTGDGHVVRAAHAVVAAGYAGQKWPDANVARNRSSYALVTDPLDAAALGPLAGPMMWETAHPYLYLRSTSDHRLLVGGEDDAVDVPALRDKRVEKKAHKLLARVHRMFPRLPLTPAYSWAGTFAETADGLPFFGPHARTGPRLHFAMAYGDNGITYSMLGARLLRALIERRGHLLSELFSFRRL